MALFNCTYHLLNNLGKSKPVRDALLLHRLISLLALHQPLLRSSHWYFVIEIFLLLDQKTLSLNLAGGAGRETCFQFFGRVSVSFGVQSGDIFCLWFFWLRWWRIIVQSISYVSCSAESRGACLFSTRVLWTGSNYVAIVAMHKQGMNLNIEQLWRHAAWYFRSFSVCCGFACLEIDDTFL